MDDRSREHLLNEFHDETDFDKNEFQHETYFSYAK